MGKAKKSRAVRVKFAQTKRLLSPKDCRLKGNQEKEETKRKKVGRERGVRGLQGLADGSWEPNALLYSLDLPTSSQCAPFSLCQLEAINHPPTHAIRHRQPLMWGTRMSFWVIYSL